ncbi:hypothetical protein ONE63_001241 [Megalurothrips usitatus]|uniref:Uncharacterized protein n=1 Tax=Megalurothrips usitatus TaxID=439358 RepID=A0AAV7XEL2_9NEOP|nr:hypothetical protein ONE63_001241 [Megalurothrips usitatus]
MPRCLMAKKWKAYPWPDRDRVPASGHAEQQDDEEEIDVVGDTSPIKTSVIRRAGGGSGSGGTGASVIQEVPRGNPASTTASTTVTEPSTASTTTTAGAAVMAESSCSSAPHQPSCWSPASPTAGATAPSPPPSDSQAIPPTSATLETRVSVLYHGEFHEHHECLPPGSGAGPARLSHTPSSASMRQHR